MHWQEVQLVCLNRVVEQLLAWLTTLLASKSFVASTAFAVSVLCRKKSQQLSLRSSSGCLELSVLDSKMWCDVMRDGDFFARLFRPYGCFNLGDLARAPAAHQLGMQLPEWSMVALVVCRKCFDWNCSSAWTQLQVLERWHREMMVCSFVPRPWQWQLWTDLAKSKCSYPLLHSESASMCYVFCHGHCPNCQLHHFSSKLNISLTTHVMSSWGLAIKACFCRTWSLNI